MSKLRFRIAAFSLVLFAAALCFSLPPMGTVTADDANSGKSAAKGQNGASDAKGNAADTDAANADAADDGKGKIDREKEGP
jgi:hypothetical protein